MIFYARFVLFKVQISINLWGIKVFDDQYKNKEKIFQSRLSLLKFTRLCPFRQLFFHLSKMTNIAYNILILLTYFHDNDSKDFSMISESHFLEKISQSHSLLQNCFKVYLKNFHSSTFIKQTLLSHSVCLSVLLSLNSYQSVETMRLKLCMFIFVPKFNFRKKLWFF